MATKGTPGATMTHATRAKVEKLIAVLIAGSTIESAGKSVGLSRKSVYRLMRDEEFQKKYREAKNELLSVAITQLHSCAGVFVETLKKVCLDPKSRGSEKAMAADRGLSNLLKAVELFDISARIEKLERIANGEGGNE